MKRERKCEAVKLRAKRDRLWRSFCVGLPFSGPHILDELDKVQSKLDAIGDKTKRYNHRDNCR